MAAIETKSRFALTLACINYLLALSFYFFDPILQVYPSVITAQLMHEYTIGALFVGLLTSAYYWSYNLIQIPGGLFCDKAGPNRILAIAYLLCAIGLFLSCSSHKLYFSVMARFLMGLGGGCSTTLLVMISIQSFGRAKLPVLMGIGQLLAGFGSITGQYGFAWWVKYSSWRHGLLLLALFALGMASISLLAAKKTASKIEQTRINPGSWTLFYQAFTQRINWCIIAYVFFLWAGFSLFIGLWGIPYLIAKYQYTMRYAWALMIAAWLSVGVGSILIGYLSRFIDKAILLLGFTLLGLLSTPLLIFFHLSTQALIISLCLFGLSGSGQALSFAVMADQVSGKVQGAMTGLLNTAVMIAPMLFEPLTGWLLQMDWKGKMRNGHPVYRIADYHLAFSVQPVLFALALLFAFGIYRYSRGKTHVKA